MQHVERQERVSALAGPYDWAGLKNALSSNHDTWLRLALIHPCLNLVASTWVV